MDMLVFLLLILMAYIVGGLPTGYMVAQLRGISDIRDHGSGNMGATNVGRMLGMVYFFIVFLIDAGKAALMVGISYACGVKDLYMIGIVCALLLGNCFTPFLSFRGGKGVATSVGILICLLPWWIMSILVSFWLFLFFITATVGISCVLTAMMMPLLVWYLLPESWTLLCALTCIACIVVIRHIPNIRRYFNQTV